MATGDDATKPAVVQAEKRQQMGLDYLTAPCPKCAVRINLSGEGLWPCHCGLVVQLVKPKG